MTNFTDFLRRSVTVQAESICSYTLGQRKVWLKKASKRHSGWVYLPLGWLSKLMGLSALMPVPNLGGSKAIQCEAERIQILKQLGIRTPEILAVSPCGILTQDIANGQGKAIQLDQALARSSNTAEKLDLYQQALDALQQVHGKQTYLSEAFARNILIDTEQHFIFIDFETDPGTVLSLKDCQVRDWLCFIFSTAYHLEEQEIVQASQLLYRYLEPYPAIYYEICQIGRKLSWAARFQLEKLGNDGLRVKNCLLFLNQLDQLKPLPML